VLLVLWSPSPTPSPSPWSPRHRHDRHHHHQPRTKCSHIRPQSVRSELQIPLENLSRRCALRKIQSSTIHAECKAAMIYTMNMRRREISSQWQHWEWGSDYNIDRHHDFGLGHPPLAIPLPPPASWCLAPATQEISGWSTQEHTWEHIVKCDWEWLGSAECNWEHAQECTWEVLEILLGSE